MSIIGTSPPRPDGVSKASGTARYADDFAVPGMMWCRALDAALDDEAGERAAAAVEPIDDIRSTADYRRWVLGRVIRRMVLELGAKEPLR